LAPIDLTRVAANILRVADVDRDRDHGAENSAPLSTSELSFVSNADRPRFVVTIIRLSGTRDLAAMVMFDLDRETLRSVTVTIGCEGAAT
jgi:hypothetical protein